MQAGVYCLAVLAILSRRPDALFRPQFYAEDGAVWYAEAYDFGWLHLLYISRARHKAFLSCRRGA